MQGLQQVPSVAHNGSGDLRRKVTFGMLKAGGLVRRNPPYIVPEQVLSGEKPVPPPIDTKVGRLLLARRFVYVADGDLIPSFHQIVQMPTLTYVNDPL